MPDRLAEQSRTALRRGDVQSALALAERGYGDWRREPASKPYWQFRLLRAEVLLARGRAKEALPLLETDPPRTPELEELFARRRLLLAHAKMLLADNAAALALADEASRIAAARGFERLEAEIEMRRGVVLARLGKPDAAENALRTARALALRQRDPYLEALALGNLGYNRLNTSHFDEAIPYFDETRARAEKLEARTVLANALSNLGRCYYGLGDFDRAVDLQSRAEVLARSVGDLFLRQIWTGVLGDTCQSRGELGRAVSCYERALAISREIGEPLSTAQWLCSLAAVELERGDLASASRRAAEARALSEKATAGAHRSWAALILAQIAAQRGELAAAETGFREVIASTATLADKQNLWPAQHGLALVYAAMNRPRDAGVWFQNALATIETARAKLPRDEWKLTFQASSMSAYRDYVEFLMARGRVESALEIAEFARARVLAQKLGLRQTLEAPVPAARFRQSAGAYGAALVSFWLAPRRSYVWIVTRNRIESAALPALPEIEPLLAAWQAAIQSGRDPLAAPQPAARTLEEVLLEPVRKAAPGCSRFIVVPDGPLHEGNLEALPVAAPRPHYWIEDATVSIAPSLAVLATGRGAAPPRRGSLFLVGDPVPPGSEFPALPEIGREIAAIRTRLASWPQTVFTGPAARPAVYRESRPEQYSVIHFAAHASANRHDPLESAVILSRDGELYKLYAREILGTPLVANLVTVSACRGAGSRVYSGEGLVGFAWAFLQAGARHVVAGLWDVNDRSTAALMDRMYSGIAAGESPVSALRSAKLGLLRSAGPFRKPYYWAPFQVFARAPVF